ncbi:aminopeptidase P family protein [Roseovarius aestuarii]|nr:aminopeptidase P family protein [Roseovarius aestuarii]
MFQTFQDKSSPEQGPPRLAAIRKAMADIGLDGYLIPRADAHQGEYVPANDERLAWVTGFTGSAGFAAITRDVAGVFVDGRYRVQVRAQVDTDHFTPIDWPETSLADWLRTTLPSGGTVGYNPMLHTAGELEKLRSTLAADGIIFQARDDMIDQIWPNRFPAPQGAVSVQPDTLAGETHASKRARLAQSLARAGQTGAAITLPDSICWLLNIRGADIPRNPVALAFAVLHADARVTLFIDAQKLDDTVIAHLGPDVDIRPYDSFVEATLSMPTPLRVDKSSAPAQLGEQLNAHARPFIWGDDPCILPKACKNPAEIAGTRTAHLRDAAVMCEFLAWFDDQAPGTLSEIDVITRLEGERAATGKLLDISFETIAGSGPHGALPHYRVSEASNRTLQAGDLLVLDSGGQYRDGTTDITRTLPVGPVGQDERAAFTRVLQGMIAISRLRWPSGLAGRDLDAIARYPLWLADQDYAHGTGHGVGTYLCVHEGPQRLSRVSDVPFLPGMIISNEPGYYREGHFGIRIENLLVVTRGDPLPEGDQTGKLCFETLNFVPIDRRLIDTQRLTPDETAWLNTYHAECRSKISPLLGPTASAWLHRVTAPL